MYYMIFSLLASNLLEKIIDIVFSKQKSWDIRPSDKCLVEQYLELLITPELRVLHLHSSSCICKFAGRSRLNAILRKKFLDSETRCDKLITLAGNKCSVKKSTLTVSVFIQ